MQIVCKCLPTCSVVEYEITYTSHYDDWSYMKSTNIVRNKYVWSASLLFHNNIIYTLTLLYIYIMIFNIRKTIVFSARGATIEFVFRKPYFTAYISTSIVDLDSLISKLLKKETENQISCIL